MSQIIPYLNFGKISHGYWVFGFSNVSNYTLLKPTKKRKDIIMKVSVMSQIIPYLNSKQDRTKTIR